jgi:hypothetical protein
MNYAMASMRTPTYFSGVSVLSSGVRAKVFFYPGLALHHFEHKGAWNFTTGIITHSLKSPLTSGCC